MHPHLRATVIFAGDGMPDTTLDYLRQRCRRLLIVQ